MERSQLPTNLVLQYSDFARNMFKFIAENIFKDMIYSKSAVLNIYSFDVYDKKLGQCNYPNQIDIYIGDIICLFSLEDFFYRTELADSYVKSLITEVLIHELLHANRVPKIDYYVSDKFCEEEENVIKRKTISILIANKQFIENAFGFSLKIDLFMDITPGPYENNDYNENSLKVYYFRMLENTFPTIRNELKTLFSYKSIILFIKLNNKSKAIRLKTNGRWNQDTVSEFQNLFCFISLNKGENISYDMRMGCSSDNKTGFLTVEIKDYKLYPMVFNK